MQDNITRIRVNVAGNSSFVTPMRQLKKNTLNTFLASFSSFNSKQYRENILIVAGYVIAKLALIPVCWTRFLFENSETLQETK